MTRQVLLFAAAVRFLTRLPVDAVLRGVGIRHGDEDHSLAIASQYFGLAGALVGLCATAVWWFATSQFPTPVAAGLAVVTAVLVSGALHEDGLADTADALGGRAEQEQALEIMRDSRIGTYGVLAVALSLGLRWAALAALDPVAGGLALIAAAATGRALVVPAVRLAPCARPSGLGGLMTSDASGTKAWNATAIALGTAIAFCLFLGAKALLALAVAGLAGWWVLRVQIRRLGGYTGDGLGAIAHAGETVALVALAGLLV